MAHSKSKTVKISQTPKGGKSTYFGEDPDKFYEYHPSWCFSRCDNNSAWSFHDESTNGDFWNIILPRLSNLETMTWKQILLGGKKENHSIDISGLNPVAQKRLTELHLVLDDIISIRINGNRRLYGFIVNSAFFILWYDKNHGDNLTCVCRSQMKHT